MINGLPDEIPGFGPIQSFDRARLAVDKRRPRPNKVAADLKAAILCSGLRDGGAISFHHHLRDGDHVVNMVLAALAELGFRDLHVA
ncbi:MAG TPA: citrate lyase subunit alpha, partial [Sphingobium sp.]